MSARVPDRIVRALGALGMAGALALALVGPALAHAHVTTATPAPEAVLGSSPPSLTLAFDSALADAGNQIALYHADRSIVGTYTPPPQNGKPPTMQTNLPALPPDIYTVAWTSVSGTDGHTLQQFFAFTVGATPDATAPPTLPPLKVGDTQVTLTANRGNVGPLVVHASVVDASGQPLTNLQRVILRYQPAGLSLGQDEIIAPATGSEAQTPAFTLGLAGVWQLDVIVRRSGLDDVDAPLQLTLLPAGSTASAATTVPTATAATVAPIGVASPTLVPTIAATVASAPTVVPTAAATITSSVPTPVAATATPVSKLPESSNSSILIAAIAVVIVIGGGVVYALRRPRRQG